MENGLTVGEKSGDSNAPERSFQREWPTIILPPMIDLTSSWTFSKLRALSTESWRRQGVKTCAIENENHALTRHELFWQNTGHTRSIIRNGQSGPDEAVKEGDPLIIHYRNAPM